MIDHEWGHVSVKITVERYQVFALDHIRGLGRPVRCRWVVSGSLLIRACAYGRDRALGRSRQPATALCGVGGSCLGVGE